MEVGKRRSEVKSNWRGIYQLYTATSDLVHELPKNARSILLDDRGQRRKTVRNGLLNLKQTGKKTWQQTQLPLMVD